MFSRPFLSHLAIACATTLALTWCVASFWFPFGWDQAMLASVGDVKLRGGMPYRDGWDMKGPLVYYVFAFAQWLFGRQMWSIRALALGLLLAGATTFGEIG